MDVTIVGVKGKKFINEKVEEIVLSKNNFSYVIAYFKNQNEEYRADYDQMLSTFRFIQ